MNVVTMVVFGGGGGREEMGGYLRQSRPGSRHGVSRSLNSKQRLRTVHCKRSDMSAVNALLMPEIVSRDAGWAAFLRGNTPPHHQWKYTTRVRERRGIRGPAAEKRR